MALSCDMNLYRLQHWYCDHPEKHHGPSINDCGQWPVAKHFGYYGPEADIEISDFTSAYVVAVTRHQFRRWWHEQADQSVLEDAYHHGWRIVRLSVPNEDVLTGQTQHAVPKKYLPGTPFHRRLNRLFQLFGPTDEYFDGTALIKRL